MFTNSTLSDDRQTELVYECERNQLTLDYQRNLLNNAGLFLNKTKSSFVNAYSPSILQQLIKHQQDKKNYGSANILSIESEKTGIEKMPIQKMVTQETVTEKMAFEKMTHEKEVIETNEFNSSKHNKVDDTVLFKTNKNISFIDNEQLDNRSRDNIDYQGIISNQHHLNNNHKNTFSIDNNTHNVHSNHTNNQNYNYTNDKVNLEKHHLKFGEEKNAENLFFATNKIVSMHDQQRLNQHDSSERYLNKKHSTNDITNDYEKISFEQKTYDDFIRNDIGLVKEQNQPQVSICNLFYDLMYYKLLFINRNLKTQKKIESDYKINSFIFQQLIFSQQTKEEQQLSKQQQQQQQEEETDLFRNQLVQKNYTHNICSKETSNQTKFEQTPYITLNNIEHINENISFSNDNQAKILQQLKDASIKSAAQEKKQIVNVWSYNMEEEFQKIQDLVETYHYVALDTEYPGIVVKLCRKRNNSQYMALKCNVDLLKIIQLGITFANDKGELPSGVTTWQFNFKFDLEQDLYSAESVNLLKNHGIDFLKHKKFGIDSVDFGELVISSGLVMCKNIKWISFHGCYDFSYLLKLLTCTPLPTTEVEFFDLLNDFFPSLCDIKYLLKEIPDEDCQKMCLNKIAQLFKVDRVGEQHQAGSDSLITCQTFFKFKESYLQHYQNEQTIFSGILYGLRNLSFRKGNTNYSNNSWYSGQCCPNRNDVYNYNAIVTKTAYEDQYVFL